MRSRHCLAWGSVTALLAAAALAQQPQTNQPRRDTTQPARPTTTQPATTTGNTGRMSPINSSNPKMILDDMDGVWRVEMRINPEKMHHLQGAMQGQANWDRANQDNANRDPARDNIDRANPGNTPDRTTPDRPGQDGRNTTPNQPGDAGRPGANQPGAQNITNNTMTTGVMVEGYCEKRWILGGDILQETCVIPDMSAARGGMDRTNPGNAARPANNPANNDVGEDGQPSLEALQSGNMLQSMCFLSFNEDNDTFDYVHMDSMKSAICHATGTFDASTGVITFNVNDVMGGGADAMHDRHMQPGYRQENREGLIDDPNDANEPGRPTTPGSSLNNDPNQPRGTTGTGTTPRSTQNPGAVTPGSPSTTTGTQPRDTTPGGTNPDRAVQPERGMDDARLNNDRLNDGMGGTREYSYLNDAGENIKVVVEILSPDQHRISMYQTDGSQSSSLYDPSTSTTRTTTTTTTPGTTTTTPGTTRTTPGGSDPAPETPGFQPQPNPDSPNPADPSDDPAGTGTGTNANRPGTTTTTQPTTTTTPGTTVRNTTTTTTIQPGTSTGNSAFKTAHGTLVWQATYTRVNGAEASRYRQFLERADQLMQAGVTDEGDDR